MNKYELMYILVNSISDEEKDAMIEKIKEVQKDVETLQTIITIDEKIEIDDVEGAYDIPEIKGIDDIVAYAGYLTQFEGDFAKPIPYKKGK